MDLVGEETLVEMGQAQWYNMHIYKLIEPIVHGDILEIGAGIGNFTNFLKKCGNLTSTDIRSDYITRLKKKHKDVKVGYGDIEKNKFFFKNTKYDTIVSINVFEHIKDDEAAIKNSHKLLKKNGYFIILVPSHMELFSEFDKHLGHYRRYSKELLRKKLQDANFDIEGIYYFNWWAAIGWWFFMKLLKSKKMPSGPVGIFDTFGKYFLSVEKFVTIPFGLSVVAICKK